jgi:hypothetical protein
MSRKLLFSMTVVTTLILASACDKDGKPDPFPPVGPGEPYTTWCYETSAELWCYYYDFAEGKWYYEDHQGQRQYIDGTPPGLPEGYVPDPDGFIPALSTEAELGLTPDGEGRVAPMMWFKNFTGSSITNFTKTDQMDFYMVIDQYWELPTDRSNLLLASIGASNVQRFGLRLANGHTGAMLLQLKNVKVEDLIEFLSQLGVKYVTYEDIVGTYKLQLSGPTPAQYTGVDFYLNGVFVANNPL